MKKNVKYIGSAVAVALLAAGSPVVIHNLIPTTIVQANGDSSQNKPVDANGDSVSADKYFAAYKAQFTDQYVSNNEAILSVLNYGRWLLQTWGEDTQYSYFDPVKEAEFQDLQDETNLDILKSNNPKDKDPYATKDSNNDFYFRDIKTSLELSDGNNDPIPLATIADYDKAISAFKAGSVVFPIHMTVRLYDNPDNNSYNPRTYSTLSAETAAPKTVELFKSQFNVTKSNTVAVIGTSMDKLANGDNSLDITDKYTTDNDAKKDRSAIYGKSLYKSSVDAIRASKGSSFDPSSTTSEGSVQAVDSSGKLNTPGTYYQTVSYKLDNSDDAAITAMINETTDDNTGNKVSPYDTNIKDTSSSNPEFKFQNLSNTDDVYNPSVETSYSVNKDTGLLTVARAVTVTDNAGPIFSTTPTVTVGSSKDSDVLKSTDGDSLQNDLNQTIGTSNIVNNLDDYYTDSDGQNSADGLLDKNGNFTKAGTYYRKVTFTLANGNVSDLNFLTKPNSTDETAQTVTFMQKVIVKNTTDVNIDPVTTKIGATVASTASDKNTLMNTQDPSTSLVDPSLGEYSGVDFGTDYYLPGTSDDDILGKNGKHAQAVSGVVDTATNTFAMSGDYLRTITFYLIKGEVATNDFSGTENKSYSTDEDTGNGTVTYVQKVHIAPLDGVNESHDTPTVTIGATAEDPNLTTTEGYTLTLGTGDNAENLIDTTKGKYNGIDLGTKYYTNPELTEPADGVETLDTATTYYRTITYYVNRNVDTIDFNGSYGKTNKTDNSVTFVQAIRVDPIKTVDADATVDSVTTNVGASEDKDSSKGSVTTPDSKEVISSFDSHYYKNAQDALDNNENYSDVVSSGTYNLAGTYYRRVTFELPNDVDTYSFTRKINGVGYATGDKTVTYIQQVNINQANLVFKADDLNVGIGESTTSVAQMGTYTTTNGESGPEVDAIESAKPESEYYANPQDALSGENPITDEVVKNNKFVKSGSFFRRVDLKVSDSLLNEYGLTGDNVSGKDGQYYYAQKVNVSDSKTATPEVKSSLTVTAGTKTDGSATDGTSLSDSSIYDLKDGNTSIVDKNGVSVSAYYTSQDGAATGDSTQLASDITDDTFTNVGKTYYRAITFKVASGDGYAYNYDGSYNVDKDNDLVTYIQAVTVVQGNVSPSVKDTEVHTGDSLDSIDNSDKSDASIAKGTDSLIDTATDVQYSDVYYTDPQAAMDSDSDKVAKVTSDGKFIKDSSSNTTYYRTVTYTLEKGATIQNEFEKWNGVTPKTNGDQITLVQAVKIDVSSAKATINDLATTVGTSVKDVDTTSDNSNITLDGDDSSPITTGDVVYGDTYYDNEGDALSNVSPTSGVKNNVFIKGGDYWHLIEFTLKDAGLSTYEISDSQHNQSSDGMKVIYAQKVHVNPSEKNVEVSIAGTTEGSPVSATLGKNASDEQKKEINEIKGMDSDGNADASLIDSSKSIAFGNYYLVDANNHPENTVQNVLGGTATAATGVVDENGNYVEPGTYYREVTIPLQSDALKSNTLPASPLYRDNGDNTVTYVQTITITGKTAKLSDTSPIQVSAGLTGSGDAESLNKTGNLTDENNELIGTPTIEDGYYKADSSADVLNGTSSEKVNDLNTAGTYYRRVTFNVDKEDAGQYDLAALNNNNNVKYNGDGTVTYVQEIDVEPDSSGATETLNNLKVSVEADGNDGKLSETGNYDITSQTDPSTSLVDKTKVEFGTLTADPANADGLDANGIITKPGKYYRTVTLNLLPGVADSYDLSDLGGTLNEEKTQITFKQTIEASSNKATASAKNETVDNGTGISNATLNNPEDVTASVVADGSTKGIPTDSIEFGNKLYGSAADAISGSNPLDVINSDGTLTKADTYYQPVTITISGNAAAYDFPGDGYSVNGNKVTFARKVTVKAATSSGGNSGNSGNSGNTGNTGNTGNNSGDNTDNNGTGDDDDWTYYQESGIVTTKTGQPFYTLNNHDNATISDRSLGENTAWITDQYRTNRAGVKQYRVATGEWIDANDVIFSQKAVDGDDDWTYYKDPGVVTTRDKQSFYMLNNRANATITNRALNEKTSWFTDQYRTNKEGVKQYRVATGEWIDSHDVIFIKDVKEIANLDTTNSIYYLYDFEEHVVTNRALSQKTSWFVDKVAEDSDGNVYYHVSTNEWLQQVKGVNIDNHAWY